MKARPEPIARVISEDNSFFFSFELADRQDWSEDLSSVADVSQRGNLQALRQTLASSLT
jgi:hypothetical protein